MEGTDIYIISGTGKKEHAPGSLVLLQFANGEAVMMQRQEYDYIQATYRPDMRGVKVSFSKGSTTTTPAIGWGSFYPEGLKAEDVPNRDEWGPDNYWTKQAYIDWFNLNKDKYGTATAISKMKQAIEDWSLILNSAEMFYCYDRPFVDFLLQYGIDIRGASFSNCSVWYGANNVASDLGDSIKSTFSFGSGVIKYGIPLVIVGGLLYYGNQYRQTAKFLKK